MAYGDPSTPAAVVASLGCVGVIANWVISITWLKVSACNDCLAACNGYLTACNDYLAGIAANWVISITWLKASRHLHAASK